MSMTPEQRRRTETLLLDAISQDADPITAETLAKLIVANNPELAAFQPLLAGTLESVLTALREGRLGAGLWGRVLSWFGL